MKSATPRMRLACILALTLTVAAFGQQTANQEANAQNAITYNDRGLAKEKKGDLNGAMADTNQAIKLNPKSSAAYDNRGSAKFLKGDLEGAMADFNQAIKLNPKNAIAYKDRGNAKRKQGDMSGATADFNQARKLGSKSIDVVETPD
jgi:Flp pilus assembly protein TadD